MVVSIEIIVGASAIQTVIFFQGNPYPQKINIWADILVKLFIRSLFTEKNLTGEFHTDVGK